MALHRWQNFVLQLPMNLTELLDFAELFNCMHLCWFMDLINKILFTAQLEWSKRFQPLNERAAPMADTVSVFGLYTTASTTAEAELITDRKRVYNAEKETASCRRTRQRPRGKYGRRQRILNKHLPLTFDISKFVNRHNRKL